MRLFTAFILAALIVALPAPAHADTRQGSLNALFDFNRAAPGAAQKHLLGDRLVMRSERVLRAKYDFALSGGAVSTISLLDTTTGKAAQLPKGALIRDCIIDVITPATTSASGTISVSTGKTAADLKAATAAASYTGLLACIPVGTAATAIKLTADTTMSVAIATGAITAGKFYVIVRYELSDTL